MYIQNRQANCEFIVCQSDANFTVSMWIAAAVAATAT